MNAQTKISAPPKARLYSPSETDLSVYDNAVQARFELDRADGDRDRLAVWAQRWARPAIDAIQNPSIDSDERADLEEQVTTLERRADDLEGAIQAFVGRADAIMDRHKPADALVNDFNDAVAALESAI